MSFIVQPVFVQGISNGLGFSAEQAGYAASAEMSGFALATILLVFLAGKINWAQGLLLFPALLYRFGEPVVIGHCV